MSARVQSSPFRETEFDQRLDRMLDDLKSTVTDDEDNSRRTPLGVRYRQDYNDPSYLQVFRSTSRSSSRGDSIGRRGGGSYLSEGVGDGGRLTHHRKEYTSPDQAVKTVAETYQYDSGEAHPAGNFQKKVVKSTYSSYNVDGGLSSELDSLKRGPSGRDMERALSQESRNILNTSYTTNNKSDSTKVIDASQKVAKELVDALSVIGREGQPLSNGHFDDDMIVSDEKGGEVRRIVWRNRYEKTYETQDSTNKTVPLVSIEKDSKNRRYNATTDINDVTNISSLTRPHVPPQISPGGQSWAEPIPLPTPPSNVSPREPGVAYIYNYGSSGGSTVQPLPPLNYVAVAPGTEGAPSPTPSGNPGQPVIYHYSYHYTIQPGQQLPEGAHLPSSATGSQHLPTNPPALQIAPPPATSYSQSTNSATNNYQQTSNISEIHKTSTNTNRDTTNVVRYPNDSGKPGSNTINYTTISSTNYRNEGNHHPFPTSPSDQHPHHRHSPPRRSPSPPKRDPNDPNRNISININKTTTHTTRTTSSRDGDFPGDGSPLTSTPYRGSQSPDRGFPRYPSGPSDSLDRVRRNPQPGMPFPETSPTKPHGDARIPRTVDGLLNQFPERNGGPYPGGYHGHPDSEPLMSTDVRKRTVEQSRTEVNLPPPERNEINTMSPTKLEEEREKTKNLAGPPVYYPPGQEQFAESMHTMTLRESGRRGKAKWRREAASGYKEQSSSSESKGGMKMVPLCLPLCCGAACSIM